VVANGQFNEGLWLDEALGLVDQVALGSGGQYFELDGLLEGVVNCDRLSVSVDIVSKELKGARVDVDNFFLLVHSGGHSLTSLKKIKLNWAFLYLKLSE